MMVLFPELGQGWGKQACNTGRKVESQAFTEDAELSVELGKGISDLGLKTFL